MIRKSKLYAQQDNDILAKAVERKFKEESDRYKKYGHSWETGKKEKKRFWLLIKNSSWHPLFVMTPPGLVFTNFTH